MMTSKLHFNTKPVPAARARISRHGAYFPKTYTDFRNELYRELMRVKKQYPKTFSAYKVEIEFICKRPKNPSNKYPVGDIDNYLKGPLDAITKAEMFWEDDIQVICLSGTKRYQKPKEDFGMKITIHELNESEADELL
jgi:Holliday junction resolvase RusA-like endonuclease